MPQITATLIIFSVAFLLFMVEGLLLLLPPASKNPPRALRSRSSRLGSMAHFEETRRAAQQLNRMRTSARVDEPIIRADGSVVRYGF